MNPCPAPPPVLPRALHTPRPRVVPTLPPGFDDRYSYSPRDLLALCGHGIRAYAPHRDGYPQ